MRAFFAGLPMSSGIPRQHPALREWYDMVQIMLDELLVWVGKKNKHFQAGYPLAARLVCICIQQPDYELANFYTFIEKLHKLMRDTIFSDAVRQQLHPHGLLSSRVPVHKGSHKYRLLRLYVHA